MLRVRLAANRRLLLYSNRGEVRGRAEITSFLRGTLGLHEREFQLVGSGFYWLATVQARPADWAGLKARCSSLPRFTPATIEAEVLENFKARFLGARWRLRRRSREAACEVDRQEEARRAELLRQADGLVGETHRDQTRAGRDVRESAILHLAEEIRRLDRKAVGE